MPRPLTNPYTPKHPPKTTQTTQNTTTTPTQEQITTQDLQRMFDINIPKIAEQVASAQTKVNDQLRDDIAKVNTTVTSTELRRAQLSAQVTINESKTAKHHRMLYHITQKLMQTVHPTDPLNQQARDLENTLNSVHPNQSEMEVDKGDAQL